MTTTQAKLLYGSILFNFLLVADVGFHGSDQEVSDPADERSEGCIAKRKRRVTSSVRRRLSKK